MAALRLPAGGHPPAHTVTSSVQGKSFADLFKQNASQPSLSIAAETATHKGEPAILFSQAAVHSLASHYHFALVGKFSKGRPKLEEVRKFFSALDLREKPTVGLLDSWHVLIQLHTEVDFHRVWFRRVWYVASAPMRIFKWTPGFHVDRESPIVPLWFQLPKLPLHFFHKEVLFQIMSCVGVPLLVDATTLTVSRPSVAHVCVKVDLLRTLPSRVWIGNGDSAGFWQELVVENLPQYCTHCYRQGHGENNCHVLHPEMGHSSGQWAKLGDVQRGQEERSSALAEGAAGAQRREKEEVQQQGSLKGPADTPNGPAVRSSMLVEGTAGSQQHGVEELQQKVSLGEEAMLQQEEYQPQAKGVGQQPAMLQALEMGCSEMATSSIAGVGVGCSLGLIGKGDGSMGSCIGESSQHLTIQVRCHLFPTPIHLSCIHAKCTGHERTILWHDLLRDNPGSSPWFLVGDFNMITNGEEKKGGLPSRPSEGVDFLNFMSEAGVVDAGFSGSRYTWCNNRPGPARIWKRLDTFLLNGTALGMHHQVTVQYLDRDPSDHAPLLLSVVLAAKLRGMKQVLRQWSTLSFGDIFETIRGAERELVDVETKYDLDPSDALRCELHQAQARLRRALSIEEGFWRQKARAKWLQDGDRNSKFFHSLVAERRRRSVIHRVRRSDREWLGELSRIGEAVISFFQKLFTAETVLPANGLLENIPSLVTTQDNVALTEISQLEEVKDIVFVLDEESAAGPDGFTGKFFTFAWEVVAMDVYRAVELVSDITRSNWGGNVVIKLDMMKVYDRVSWPFLLQVLRRFGFSETWIDMIWRLVSNVWFSVLVNGAPQGFFKSSRGLWQGDPILPALFVLSAEAIVVGQVLGFQRRAFPVRYLGCPLYVGRRKKIYFADVYNAVVAQILSWKHKLLSVGGRVVLIKSVLASMLVHLLTAASPPKGVIVALERVFVDFLWGTSDFGTKFHWIQWEALCRPRDEGGIGLRRLKDVHDSFSVKLWWNFRQQKSHWAEFMAGKYCAGLHPCLAEASQRGSLTWKRMSSIQQVAEDSISWVVSAGLMNFWHDNWLGTGVLCQKVEIFHDHLVANFVDRVAWNIVMLNRYLDAGLVACVLAMDPPTFQGPDRMVWALTPSGSFSMASAYSLVWQGGHRSRSAAAIWHQCIPLKISFFMLRLLQDRLPTMDRLRGAGV
ncbi:uncharacterized protein [Coffea arabica]|uniref:DUF4283 domain-containing protein n=1 Tax=Coffea arabica TaxID=13443 RepID=A0ABM4VZA8_COFAR